MRRAEDRTEVSCVRNRLGELISRAGLMHAARPAIVYGERRVSFAETEALSNRIASAFRRQLGLEKGDRVAALLTNCPEYVIADFALIKGGLVRVPVNPRLSPSEIEFILMDSGARLVLYGGEFAPVVEHMRERLSDVEHFVAVDPPAPTWAASWDELAALGDAAPFHVPVSTEDDYMILYTSGTTGNPKGALTNVRSRWVTLFHVYANENFIGSRDVMLHVASLAHGSGTKVLPNYISGATNVLLPELTMDAFCVAVEEHRVTTTWLVPTLVGRLLDFPDRERYNLSSLRTVVYAGAPMPPERLKEALRVFGRIFVQVYGLSEAPQPGLVLTKEDHVLEGPPEALERLASAGRPALGVEVRIAGEDGKDVALGEIGEIWLAGDHLMTGYWKRPDATAEVLRDGWFHTGDLARVDEAGYVFIVDRAKDMIISGGYNVYPREVEDVLYRHPAVRECAVFGVPDDDWGEAVWAAVAVRNGACATEEELIDHCRLSLAGYKKPRRIEFLNDLPKSATNKILRKALRDPHWEGRHRKV